MNNLPVTYNARRQEVTLGTPVLAGDIEVYVIDTKACQFSRSNMTDIQKEAEKLIDGILSNAYKISIVSDDQTCLQKIRDKVVDKVDLCTRYFCNLGLLLNTSERKDFNNITVPGNNTLKLSDLIQLAKNTSEQETVYAPSQEAVVTEQPRTDIEQDSGFENLLIRFNTDNHTAELELLDEQGTRKMDKKIKLFFKRFSYVNALPHEDLMIKCSKDLSTLDFNAHLVKHLTNYSNTINFGIGEEYVWCNTIGGTSINESLFRNT